MSAKSDSANARQRFNIGTLMKTTALFASAFAILSYNGPMRGSERLYLCGLIVFAIAIGHLTVTCFSAWKPSLLVLLALVLLYPITYSFMSANGKYEPAAYG